MFASPASHSMHDDRIFSASHFFLTPPYLLCFCHPVVIVINGKYRYYYYWCVCVYVCIARLVHICLIVSREALPLYILLQMLSVRLIRRRQHTVDGWLVERQEETKCGNLFVYKNNVQCFCLCPVQPFGVLEKLKIVFTTVVCVCVWFAYICVLDWVCVCVWESLWNFPSSFQDPFLLFVFLFVAEWWDIWHMECGWEKRKGTENWDFFLQKMDWPRPGNNY